MHIIQFMIKLLNFKWKISFITNNTHFGEDSSTVDKGTKAVGIFVMIENTNEKFWKEPTNIGFISIIQKQNKSFNAKTSTMTFETIEDATYFRVSCHVLIQDTHSMRDHVWVVIVIDAKIPRVAHCGG